MKKRLLTLALILLASAARADMYPDASNAKMPDARQHLGMSPCAMGGNYTLGNVPGEWPGMYACSYITVTADTSTNTMSSSGIAALDVYHGWGGGGSGEGSRMGIWANLDQKGAIPAGIGLHHYQTGIFSQVTGNFSQGGTAGTGIGELYGYAAQVVDGPGHTNSYGAVGGEIDIAVYNASTAVVEGWGVASVPLSFGNPTNHGVLNDAGYGLWAGGTCGAGALAGGSGCAGFNTGLSFGRSDSYFPISQNGTIIAAVQGVGTQANMRALQGIDFSKMTFSGAAIITPGFTVNGTGNLSLSSAFPAVTYNPGTITNLARFVYAGSNQYCFQYNTAANGDFSTDRTPYCVGPAGDIYLGPGANVAPAATQGFVRIGSIGGAPTGVPAGAGAGDVPIAVDQINNKLCYYNAGWRCL